ncbi:hypothetical protein [Oscillatoria nigro-viridis]|uniref:hypothetical protein n=1 Tax=Phormidium nigroviride TaxID=482564 RepID=UPI0002EF4028|nr:hypothetical protein [Oscillatoria nigro-viridis]
MTSDINPVKSSREMRNMRAGYRSLYYRTQTAIRQCRPSSIALKSWNPQTICLRLSGFYPSL